MNKKLLALAVGAALGTAPMMASAGVTWYGQVSAEIASEDATGPAGDGLGASCVICPNQTDGVVTQGGGGRFQDGNSVEDNKRGRLGVKASEKLGNGMTAIAKMEWQISTVKADIDDGDREAFVGLKGGFGTVQVGSVKSPYKYMGGVKYDPFVTTNLEARRYGGMSTGRFGQNSFWTDSISYQTPKMGGFKAWAVYSPDEVDGTDGDTALGLMFKQKMFEVFVASASDDSSGYDAVKIGGAIKFGGHKFKLQYEDLDANGLDGNIIFAGYQGKFGNNVLVAQVAEGEVEYATSQDNSYYAIGVIHKFSKKTRLFAGFGGMEVDNAAGLASNNGDRDVFTVGMRMDFK